ncbi:hypothetical protein GJ629_15410, partial [Halapricum sp. CBA1109]|nr:hypothetical protein [Halapricum sp. CBA1109]
MDADAVRERANELPGEPGVYRFLDAAVEHGDADDFTDVEADAATVLYVGKAVDLRDRVRSYADPRGERIRRMVDRAAAVDTVVTDTETQALLLEAN